MEQVTAQGYESIHKPEKLHGIAAGLCEHFVKIQILGEGNGTGDFHAVPGFTALSAIGHRCHVRGIGFDHEFFKRKGCGNGAQLGIFLESKVARKTDMSARVDNASSGFKCSAEAVHYKADFAGIFAFENFERRGFQHRGHGR